MTARGATLLAAAVAVVVGCGDRRPPTATPSVSGVVGGLDAGAPADADRVVEPAAPPRLAPHSTAIAGVAIDRDSAAAVTIDLSGAVRLWPTLDGTREPAALPIHGALALDLAASDDGFVVGAIDASGAPHLYRLDDRGGLRGSADIPAVPQAVGLVALGPDAWLLVRADQSIELYDRAGDRRDGTARDGTRVEAIRAEAVDRALIITSQGSGAGVRFAATALTVAAGRLAWGTPLPLAIAPDRPVEVALAPDGKHLAYLSTRALVTAAAPAAAPRPAPVRPSGGLEDRAFGDIELPPLPAGVVVVVDRATGADVTPAALRDLTLSGARRLGFTDAGTLLACASDGSVWSSALAADATPTALALPFSALPAIGVARVVVPLASGLQIVDRDGARMHLGYQVVRTRDVALSPSGDRVAVVSDGGALLVAATDGGDPVIRAAAATEVVGLAFVDDDAVVAMRPGELLLVDARDGAVRDRATIPQARGALQWSPRARRLAGLRAAGGWWTTSLTGARFEPVRQLDDGAVAGWLVDGADADGPALVSADGAGRARTYRGRDLDTPRQAAAVKTTPTRPLPPDVVAITLAGEVVRAEGTLRRYPSLEARAGIDLGHVGAAAVASVPGSDRLLVVDANGLAQAFAADGRLAWALMLGGQPSTLTVSADGRRAAVLTTAGLTIVDVATGAPAARRCGWDFGLTSTPPDRSTLAVPSVCE